MKKFKNLFLITGLLFLISMCIVACEKQQSDTSVNRDIDNKETVDLNMVDNNDGIL